MPKSAWPTRRTHEREAIEADAAALATLLRESDRCLAALSGLGIRATRRGIVPALDADAVPRPGADERGGRALPWPFARSAWADDDPACRDIPGKAVVLPAHDWVRYADGG